MEHNENVKNKKNFTKPFAKLITKFTKNEIEKIDSELKEDIKEIEKSFEFEKEKEPDKNEKKIYLK
jgi:hypothetical protein